MITVYLLFLIPILLFVLAFLYETYLSFRRLAKPQAGREGYVHATWEITHTLLIFGVVVMLMMFTKSIDQIATAIFLTTFLAAVALTIRLICYIYIFYVRSSPKTSLADWIFALSHVFAALFLVLTVFSSLWFLYSNNPAANTQFVPAFVAGLVLVLGVCLAPMVFLYSAKKSY